jgi:hypothetical protein
MRSSAQQLLPLLQMTDAQFKEMAEDQKRYGVILSKDNVMAARQYFYAMHDMEDSITGVKLALGNLLIPGLTEFNKILANSITAVKDFAKEQNIDLVGSFQQLATDIGNSLKIVVAHLREFKDEYFIIFESLAVVLKAFVIVLGGLAVGIGLVGAGLVELNYEAAALGNTLVKIFTLGAVSLDGWVASIKKGRDEAWKWWAEQATLLNKIMFPEKIVKTPEKTPTPEKTSPYPAPPVPGAEKAYDDVIKKISEMKAAYVSLTNPLAGARLELEAWIDNLLKTAKIDPTKIPEKLAGALSQLRTEFEKLKAAEEALKVTEAMEKATAQDISDVYAQQNQILQNSYEDGIVSLETYYKQRKTLAEQQANEEIALLEKQIERAKTADPSKVIDLESQSRAKKAKLQKENIKLTREEIDEQRKLAELNIALAKSGVEMAYARKDIDYETYLQKQIDLNRQLLAFEVERLKVQVPNSEAYMETMQKINDILAQQVDLQSRLEEKTGTFWKGLQRGYKEWSDSVKSKFEIARDTFKEVMTAMRDTFKDFFLDALEGKLKSFSDYWQSFAQKLREIWAGALADMLQDWIKNFIKKLMSQGIGSIFSSIGGVLGIIFGGSGGTGLSSGVWETGGRMAGAEGGAIRGGSGVRDDVRLLAMGGEFLHPVQAVKYYGEGIMEAIRLRRIPRNLLSQFSAGFAPRPSYAFAGGGMVSTQPAGNSLAINVPVNIENPRLASMLRSNIEDVVRRTLREFM